MLFIYIESISAESWSCLSPVGRVYSRPNPPATLEFDLNSRSSFNNYGIWGYRDDYLIQDYNGRKLADLSIIYIYHFPREQTIVENFVLDGVDVTFNSDENVQMTIYKQEFLKAGTYRIFPSNKYVHTSICSCLFLLGK